ncbi:unnamed protein product [Cuscuta europaea]|nr:unnamed protein product [Cuscuta europaea]
MWGEFVNRHGHEIERCLHAGDFPLVLINRAAINLFQGLTLATRFDSHVELNPDGERALNLKKWVTENKCKIHDTLHGKEYDDALTYIAKPLLQPQTTISNLETALTEILVVWVYGKFSLPDTSEEGYYIGCNYCNRRVHGIEGASFQCIFCGQKNGTTVKRFRLNALLGDGTGTIPVTLFTNDVLHLFEFIGMDATAAMDLELFNTNIQKIHILTGVKRTKTNEEGLQGNPYTVVSVSKKHETSPEPNSNQHVTPPPPPPIPQITPLQYSKLLLNHQPLQKES